MIHNLQIKLLNGWVFLLPLDLVASNTLKWIASFFSSNLCKSAPLQISISEVKIISLVLVF